MTNSQLDWSTHENNIWFLTQREAFLKIKEMLAPEIRVISGGIMKRNPNISNKEILEQYISNLRYLKDPRIDFIDGVYSWTMLESELDQAIQVLENMTKARVDIILQKQEKWWVDKGSGLDFDIDLGLRQSIKNTSHQDLIERVSVKDRKYLDILLNALVLWNMGLMSWEFFDVTQPLVQEFYWQLSDISNWVLSWDQTIWLLIISVFWAEAFLKIREQWLLPYLKNNKIDVTLNMLWAAELWTIAYDVFKWESHLWIASILRWFRALRVLKVLNKIPSIQQLWLQVQTALPKTMEFTGIYVAFSWITMFILMQMLWKQIPEFSTFWDSYSSMRDLFFADGYQIIFEDIENASWLDWITKTTAEALSNLYMASSNYFYAAVVSGILVDSINQWSKRIEQMLSLTLEKVSKLLGSEADKNIDRISQYNLLLGNMVNLNVDSWKLNKNFQRTIPVYLRRILDYLKSHSIKEMSFWYTIQDILTVVSSLVDILSDDWIQDVEDLDWFNSQLEGIQEKLQSIVAEDFISWNDKRMYAELEILVMNLSFIWELFKNTLNND